MKGYNMTNEERAYAEALDGVVEALQKAIKTGSEVYEVYREKKEHIDSDLTFLSRTLDDLANMYHNMYTQNYKKEDN